jgi:RNA 3'-terminal phosphate cyclase (ATP)
MVIENLPTFAVILHPRKKKNMGRKNGDNHERRKPARHPEKDHSPHLRPRNSKTVHLDGSTLEGGGQLVRVALTLSALTGIPVHITRIRAGRGVGRNSGGLKESHLAALEVLAEECGASVEGGFVGSKELLFEPGIQRWKDEETGKRNVELQKPGSVWLILQALLPWYLLRDGSYELTLRGGTNVSSSMSGDYVQQVLLPTLEKIGLPRVNVEVVQRGWAGNAIQIGEAKVSVGDLVQASSAEKIVSPRAFNVQDRDSISKISITVVAHPESMRNAIRGRASEEVGEKFPNAEIEITIDEDSCDVRRLYILLVAHTSNGWRLGRDYLGTGKSLKNQKEIDALVDGSVRKVTDELLEEVKIGGCVDEHMQDQLVVFQALAAGISAVDAGEGREKGTLHTQTVRWVCREMLGGTRFESVKGGVCMGIGRGSRDQANIIQHQSNGTDKRPDEELTAVMR